MRRRRWPWIIALAFVALMAGIIFWPRHDDYAFLRELHPEESNIFYRANAHEPELRVKHFRFSQSFAEVRKFLLDHGAQVQDSSKDYLRVRLPSGPIVTLSDADEPVTLRVKQNRPTWIQARLQAIREFFHL